MIVAARRDRVAAGVLIVAAVLFVAVWIPGSASAGFAGAITVPLTLLGVDLLIAAALLTRWYPVRPVAQGLAVFGVLVHSLVALRGGPAVARACSVVLALAHAWMVVSLIMLTAAEDADAQEPDEDPAADPAGDRTGEAVAAAQPPVDDGPRAVEITGEFRLEVPIADVVDLESPPHDPTAEPAAEPPVRTGPHEQENPR